MRDKLVGVFILLMGLIAAGMGGAELLNNLVFKTPTSLTWSQFIAEKPKAGWFKILGAQLHVAEGIWVDSRISGEMGHGYVPARAAGDDGLNETGQYLPFKMLVKIDDPKNAATVKDLKELDKGTQKEAEAATMEYLMTHGEQLRVERTVVGTLAKGFDEVDAGDKSAILNAKVALDDDFVILQEGTKPDKGGRISLLLGGIGLSLLGLFYIFLKKTTPPAPPATASGYPLLSK